MMDLDSREIYEREPYRRAFGIVREFAEDLLKGIESGRKITIDVESPNNVILMGMGGSGIICDVAAQLFSRAGVRAEVLKSYNLRSDDWDLAIAVSHSGNTAETIKPVIDLIDRGVKIIFVTSNGFLLELGKKLGIPTAIVRGDVPPRYGFPNMLGAILGIMERLGLRIPSPDAVEIETFRSKIDESKAVHENPAKQSALRIVKSTPVIYVYHEVRNAGYRLKCQLNENSKIYCGFAEIPEALHNEIETISSHNLIIIPRSFKESRELTESIKTLTDFLGEEKILSIKADSRDEFGELIQLFMFMDYISLYAAILKKADPLKLSRVPELRKRNPINREILKRAGKKT